MYLTSDEQRLARITERAHASSAREVPLAVQAYLSAPPRRVRKKPSAMPQIADESGDGFLLDRRHCERVALAGEVTVRRIGGFNFQVGLEDVSPAGCRIEMIEEAQAGEAIIARFPELEPLGGEICWTKATTAGLHFSRPIHSAVFESLLGRIA